MSTYVTTLAKTKNLKVVNATKNLSLTLLDSDVTFAKQKNSKCCAFAKACKRQFKQVKNAYFFKSTAWLEYDDKIVRYSLPTSVQKEIVSFDRSKIMANGVYHLSKASPATKKSAAKVGKAGKRTGKGPKSPRVFRHKTTMVRDAFDPARP